MFEADLITVDLRDNPVYTDIVEQYTSLFECFSEKQEFEDHCKSFIEALTTAGGPLKRVAAQLQDEWKLTVKTQLHIDLDF